MKTHYIKSIVVIVCLLLSFSVKAYDFESGGIYYNIVSLADLTAEVTSGGSKYIGEIIIPETVTYNGKILKITAIGNSAFLGCQNLTSITIPNTVAAIGNSAFFGCISLTSITIPNSVKIIRTRAFSDCGSLTSLTIPNSVTTIDSYAFSTCSGLTSLTIPNSVTTIGESAFINCRGLTSLTIPNSVTTIGENAFDNCRGLTSLTIPNSVTTIDSYAFNSCSGLTSITIPNSVTTIGKCTFNNCSSLTSITIPSSVTSIGDYAFKLCISLTSIIIPNSVKMIGTGAFYGCSSLTSITIPSSVITIDSYAFSDCTSLISVTISNSITTIGESAFRNCRGLTSVIVQSPQPASITDVSFSNITYMNATLYVPQGCIENYQKATGWKSFFTITDGTPIGWVYTLSVTGGKSGKISFLDQEVNNTTIGKNVQLNEKVVFTITPDNGYKIAAVTLNNQDITSQLKENTYTIEQLNENVSFNVQFDEIPIYMTIQQAESGLIKYQIDKDKSYIYQIVPAENWSINTVMFNGEDVTSQLDSNSTLTTPLIKDNSTLNISFESINTSVSQYALSQIKVYGDGDKMIIENAEPGENIAICNDSGVLLKSFEAKDERIEVQLPINKIYIVKTKGKSVKMRL